MKNESSQTKTVEVHGLAQLAPKLRADDWRSPLVRRLLGEDKYKDSEATLTDSFRGTDQLQSEHRSLLQWSGLEDDYKKCVNTYQGPDITAFAALGVSCILVRHRTDLEITEVTRRGERADYWIGDREHLLEVSGQENGSLDTLRDEKAVQLLDNPFGLGGYVCVVNFTASKAYLWFYRQEAEK